MRSVAAPTRAVTTLATSVKRNVLEAVLDPFDGERPEKLRSHVIEIENDSGGCCQSLNGMLPITERA